MSLANHDPVVAWFVASEQPPIDEKWVPGASCGERKALAALGGLVTSLLGDTHDPALPADVARWLAEGPSLPLEVLEAARQNISSAPDSALADLYAGLVDSEHRRHLGTFFTPAEEVTLMLDMWCRSQPPPKTVVDVGAGVGVFTAASITRWPGATVHAVDVNPVTLGLLAARVAADFHLVANGDHSPGVRLVLDDFTRWIRTEWDRLPTSRLIIGNPPYTRAQLLPIEDRERLHAAADGLCGRRASLSTLMTAIALRALGPNDGLCFLLPAQWLESQYAIKLRQRLWATQRRRVELRLVDSWQFADAQVDAVALLVGTEEAAPAEFVFGSWQRGDGESIPRDGGEPDCWRSLFGRTTTSQVSQTTDATSVRLGDLAIVRRGVATGANAFFLLSDDDLSAAELHRRSVIPVVRRLANLRTKVSQIAFDRLSGSERRWLLRVTSEHREREPEVDQYLIAGENAGVDQHELCRRREIWYDVHHDIFVPDIIISSMTRDSFHVVENEIKAVITNNLYGWRWRDGTSNAMRDRVVRWLRGEHGQHALKAAARTQAQGLMKLEPVALRDLRLPGEVTRSFKPQTAGGSPSMSAAIGSRTNASVQRPAPSSGK